ncbi:MAG: DUF2339 domain-containing protein [Rhizobiales bacterium]|nr:DUF2339 domain-containing protein [Hyphomicrobiales bacterium]
MFELLIGLVILAIPIAAIAGFVVALNTRDRLKRIEHRLGVLEGRIAAAVTEAPAQAEPPPVTEPEPPQPAVAEEPAAVAPETPAAAPQAAPTAQPERAHAGFEERFGTQWVVWVGGLALALGGLFLVRYSIEQGLLGPAVRIALGALLAAGLLAAGEWTRRKEYTTGIAGGAVANIPSMLTAASTVVAYATVYAAYALYGYLPPALAFVLLGVVAVLTLAAALLHGPALAGIGLIGAYVTPILVASDTPDYWALYVYLAIVTAAAFALARARLWQWLAIAAIVLSVLWTYAGLDGTSIAAPTAHAFHALAGFLLAAALLVCNLYYGPSPERGRVDAMSSGALAAYLFAALIVVLASRHAPIPMTAFALMTAGTVAIAWRTDAAAAALPFAALLTALLFVEWAVDVDVTRLILPAGPTAGAVPEPQLAYVGMHLVLGAGFAALFGVAGFIAQGRSERAIVPILWSAAGVFAALAILAALYYRVANFERSIPFAGLALMLAAIGAWASETLHNRPPRPGQATSVAIFATGTVAALALAMTMALERGWLTVALALMVPGIAWVAEKRPVPMLRWLAGAVALVVLARIVYDPRIVGTDIGTTPIFNWLLYGYGVPAAAFWCAGWMMRKRTDDVPLRMVESAALLLTVLLVFLEIRHLMNKGNVFRDNARLAEVALQVCCGLAMTIGLERLRHRSGSIVHSIGAQVIAALTLLAIVVGLFVAENPLLTGDPVGGSFFNLLLLGYGLPAILAGGLALVVRGTRPKFYSIVAVVAAVALALAYLTLEVTTLFHGPVLTRGRTTDAEQYAYSAVWLSFGVLLLIAGFLLRSQPARLASAAVVVLTIGKVFLVDMAGLTGVYRALSFIGLGLVLVGIGWLYQRLLFPPRHATGAESPPDSA